MCGITGILTFDQNTETLQTLIQKMTDTVKHRGPDDEGFYVDNGIALAQRRLAIIDLSPGGHQPMAGPDGSTWMVYNGEIYNYQEIRAGLENRGHCFKSQSDSEVILHAYQEYGPDCLALFNGMFALAIWDSRRRQLFLARDRLGVKPLYYYRDSHCLMFASEIKAILAVIEARPVPNERLVYDFLTTGMLDHTSETFFTGICKLPAAHYMLIDAQGREQVRRYWDFEVNDEAVPLLDKAVGEQSEAFFELLVDAVRLRLISDVSVGSCLSGGLDSSTVVSIISRLIKEQKAASVGPRQQTFSACYQGSNVDEQPYIDQITQWSGALSHKVFPQAEGFKAEFPDLLWHQEEPFAGTSIYAQWTVMRLAREHGVTVLLDGQGADEQLLGYRKFYAFYGLNLFNQGRPLAGMAELIKHFGSWEVLKTLKLRRGLRYFQKRQLGATALGFNLLQDPLAEKFKDSPLNIGLNGSLGERIKADMTQYSIPVLLRYEDKNSMAFAREARVPFLDYRLVEFVGQMPLNLKLRDGWTKYCLRRGAQGQVPEAILKRRDKLGFATPEENWLRQALVDDIQQTFQQAVYLPHWVKLPELQEQFKAYLNGQRPLLSGDFFFRFFILEQWAQLFKLN